MPAYNENIPYNDPGLMADARAIVAEIDPQAQYSAATQSALRVLHGLTTHGTSILCHDDYRADIMALLNYEAFSPLGWSIDAFIEKHEEVFQEVKRWFETRPAPAVSDAEISPARNPALRRSA